VNRPAIVTEPGESPGRFGEAGEILLQNETSMGRNGEIMVFSKSESFKTFIHRTVMAVVILGVGLLGACGNPELSPTPSSTSLYQGELSTQVDLLIAVDESSSALFGPNGQDLKNGLRSFLSKLTNNQQNLDWDLRIGAVGLQTGNSSNKIWASHDQKLSAAPIPTDSLFQGDSNVDHVLGFFEPGESGGAEENAFHNIIDYLSENSTGKYLLRPGAQLVILNFSNGDDVSDGYMDFANRQKPITALSDKVKNDFLRLKDDRKNLVQFHAIVSDRRVTNASCRKQNALAGIRYKNLEYFLNEGQDFDTIDICEIKSFDKTFERLAQNIKPVQKTSYSGFIITREKFDQLSRIDYDDYIYDDDNLEDAISIRIAGREVSFVSEGEKDVGEVDLRVGLPGEGFYNLNKGIYVRLLGDTFYGDDRIEITTTRVN
jgi:hypothetical protein